MELALRLISTYLQFTRFGIVMLVCEKFIVMARFIVFNNCDKNLIFRLRKFNSGSFTSKSSACRKESHHFTQLL
jgi:hypothetical protein